MQHHFLTCRIDYTSNGHNYVPIQDFVSQACSHPSCLSTIIVIVWIVWPLAFEKSQVHCFTPPSLIDWDCGKSQFTAVLWHCRVEHKYRLFQYLQGFMRAGSVQLCSANRVTDHLASSSLTIHHLLSWLFYHHLLIWLGCVHLALHIYFYSYCSFTHSSVGVLFISFWWMFSFFEQCRLHVWG